MLNANPQEEWEFRWSWALARDQVMGDAGHSTDALLQTTRHLRVSREGRQAQWWEGLSALFRRRREREPGQPPPLASASQA
jgi:hypothetical protein